MKKIDFHAHILPGADHGSDGIETSLKQLELAQAAKIDIVVATPHFYPNKDTFAAFAARRTESVKLLTERKDGSVARPGILIGAEVHLCIGLENMPDVRQLCVGGSDVILVEMPFSPWSGELSETLRQLEQKCGLRVVLAHIDRYPFPAVEALLREGFLAQLNAECFEHLLRRRKYRFLVENTDSVVALGSDIHGCEHGYKSFLQMEKLLGSAFESVMERSMRLLEPACAI